MLYVKVTGLHPQLDGEYPLDGSSFTNRELRTIKQMSGVRALELRAAFRAGDNDLLVAFASIALARAGKVFDEEVLWDADGGALTFEERDEGDAVPPAEATSGGSAEPSNRSGAASSNGGERSPETSTPHPSGVPV